MKKALVIGGLVVVGAAACSAVAWYTGKQLPEVLETSLAQSNRQLAAALSGSGTGKVELLSLESGVFSSDARYRVTLEGVEGEHVQLDFSDHLEHGPFPWSRVKRLQLLPVMAASSYALEKTDDSAPWFAAAGEQAPLQGSMSVGYGGAIRNELRVMPFEVSDEDGFSLSFSGLTLHLDSALEGEGLRLRGELERVAMASGGEGPTSVTLKGVALSTDFNMSGYGYFVGSMNVDIAESALSFGDSQSLRFGKFEQRDVYRIEEGGLSLKQAVNLADISFSGKPIGSARMAWRVERLNPEAVGSLVKWYEQNLAQLESMALGLTPDTGAAMLDDPRLQAPLRQLLAGGPRVALEELAFKTANGESRLAIDLDLSAQAPQDVPLEQAFAQSVKSMQTDLKLSKPMLGDLAALRATLEGLDAEQVRQASASGEMVGMIALQSQLATVQGDDILMRLGYADGQVDFNGQKMTVDQFAELVQQRTAAFSGAAQ
ncbi:YdgA family protein [Pseudomonas japonica]|uniref:YdgA family protein n=1 Tax=Pseudomonas japonica TaxID=256466 RepID=UPI00380BFE5D